MPCRRSQARLARQEQALPAHGAAGPLAGMTRATAQDADGVHQRDEPRAVAVLVASCSISIVCGARKSALVPHVGSVLGAQSAFTCHDVADPMRSQDRGDAGMHPDRGDDAAMSTADERRPPLCDSAESSSRADQIRQRVAVLSGSFRALYLE